MMKNTTYRTMTFLIFALLPFPFLNCANNSAQEHTNLKQYEHKGDTQIYAKSAKATSENAPTNTIEKSIDGVYKSFFNSRFGVITEWPFNLDFFFEDVAQIDYLIYHPRQDKGNYWGTFHKVELWASTKGNPTLTKYADYDLSAKGISISILSFDKPLIEPTQIRIAVKSAFMDRVSAGEIEFFKREKNENLDLLTIFADESCSQLAKGVDDKKIAAISDPFFKELALKLKAGNYDSEFRVQTYRPYQSPVIVAEKNKIMPYSLLDNATGMYISDEDEQVAVLVGNTHGQQVTLVIQDLMKGYMGEQHVLQTGMNLIKPKLKGLIYILYHTLEDIPLLLETKEDINRAKEKSINIHFAGGTVNGYFDKKIHSSKDWKRILSNATYREIDIIGDYTHITWNTNELKTANTDAIPYIANFDELVHLEHEFMGLYKYDKKLRNRAYMHIDYTTPHGGFATAYHTAYSGKGGYRDLFTQPERFRPRIWAPAHELGHCNQLDPGLKWTGMGEVSNNFFGLYAQQKMGAQMKLMKDNLYEKAKKEIMDKGIPHCVPGQNNNYARHEWKLVPFWQLQLYIADAKGYTDLYKDLYEHYRVTEPDNIAIKKYTEGIVQLDFVRNVCNFAQTNLLDFFKAWGFLTPVDARLDDYGTQLFTITQKQIDDLIAEIEAKGYEKPAKKVEDITDANVAEYK